MMMLAFMKVKGHSKVIKGQIINHAIWLSNLSEEPLPNWEQ